jgi:hypothetical protein
VADILDDNPIGRHVAHGDVDAAVAAIQAFLDAPPAALAILGETAQRVLTQRFTQDYLCGKFCDALERALGFDSESGTGLQPVSHGLQTHATEKTHAPTVNQSVAS